MRSQRAIYLIRVASLGDYRKRTVKELLQRFRTTLEIQAGDRSPDNSVNVLTPADVPQMHSLKNIYFPAHILTQRGGWLSSIRATVLVLDFNPRVLDAWLLLLLRRVLGRRTLVWGHAWPRKGSVNQPGRLRQIMRRLSNGVITYTTTQARQLHQLDPALPVFPAPNALYRRVECRFDEYSTRDTFLYVGRMVEAKKPGVLLSAFNRAWLQRPEIRLTFIGDGPLLASLTRMAADLECRDAIQFLGHESRYETLRGQYARAVASVSPGYVGLSVTQSLAFGVPMIIADREPHAPEIEAVSQGVNAIFFEADSTASLAQQIVSVWDSRREWERQGVAIAEACATHYSVEVMAEGIERALRDAR